jgi:hypothetical protein
VRMKLAGAHGFSFVPLGARASIQSASPLGPAWVLRMFRPRLPGKGLLALKLAGFNSAVTNCPYLSHRRVSRPGMLIPEQRALPCGTEARCAAGLLASNSFNFVSRGTSPVGSELALRL